MPLTPFVPLDLVPLAMAASDCEDEAIDLVVMLWMKKETKCPHFFELPAGIYIDER